MLKFLNPVLSKESKYFTSKINDRDVNSVLIKNMYYAKKKKVNLEKALQIHKHKNYLK